MARSWWAFFFLLHIVVFMNLPPITQARKPPSLSFPCTRASEKMEVERREPYVPPAPMAHGNQPYVKPGPILPPPLLV
ncbi:hypothetical protein SUGI_1011880 [Cryptomeria japonica]|nr:hypothetical protein SUGI_1011880 [Cryptomeria japonica]